MTSTLPPNDVVRVGVHAGQQHTDLDAYVRLWQRVEALGYDWVSLFDHFLPIQSDPTGPCFEGPTLLAYLAAKTSRIRTGLLVTGNTYRHPAVLANVAATLDHVTGGRLEFGIGAGWFELEHAQYGIDFHTLGTRLAMFREAAVVVRKLLHEETTSFQGRYYTLTDARCEPKPLQQPFPLWVGGAGERKTLRVVAESADGWNMLLPSEEEYRRKLDALAGHCADVGRDPTEIRKSLIFWVVLGDTEAGRGAARGARRRAALRPGRAGRAWVRALSAEQCVEWLLPYLRLGVRDFLVMARPPRTRRRSS
ncbi:MAG: TIGR03560 family F420-dependent LLM class oxidoreductase [Thermoleophilia bacterium]